MPLINTYLAVQLRSAETRATAILGVCTRSLGWKDPGETIPECAASAILNPVAFAHCIPPDARLFSSLQYRRIVAYGERQGISLPCEAGY